MSALLAQVAADQGRSLAAELGEFAPLWILLVAAVLTTLTDAFARVREAGFQRGLALLAVALAFASAWSRVGDPELDLGTFGLSDFLLSDHLSVTCDLLALAALAGVIGLARPHGRGPRSFGEREPLLLLAGAGALACIHAGDLLTVWLGVELLTVAATLSMLASPDAVATPAKRAAQLGQWVSSAIVSCLLLLGIALIYAALHTTNLDGLAHAVTREFAGWGGSQRWIAVADALVEDAAARDPQAAAAPGEEITRGLELLAERDPAGAKMARSEMIRGLAPVAMLLPGLLLVLAGLLTKLGMLPFARRRELNEEAPLHVSALWSSVASVALVAVLLRVFVGSLHTPRLVNDPYGWTGALPTVALLTGGWAALSALRQRRLSKTVALLCLVQLSIVVLGLVAAANFHGHIGAGGKSLAPEYEILWARLAGDAATGAVLVLLVAHVIAAVGCFGAIAASRGFRGPEVRMQHWAGMAGRRPGLALAFAICLLSLVGLPPLCGFVGKLGVMRALVEHSSMRWMAVVVAAELAICAWVALKIVATMYFGDDPVSEPGERREPSPWPARVAASAAVLSIVGGLGGQRLIEIARLPAAGGSFEPGDPDRIEWLEQRREAWAIEDRRFEVGVGEEESEEASEQPGGEEGEVEVDPELEAEAQRRKMSIEPRGD